MATTVPTAAARSALAAVGESDPHSTTLLAAAALLELASGARVLDVGAGTGILAALALRAGAARAAGIERRPELVEAGRRLHPEIELIAGDAEVGLPVGPFDVVVANLPWPLVGRLVPSLAAASAGALVVTGARLVQGPPLRRALARARCIDICAAARNGWCLYRARVTR